MDGKFLNSFNYILDPTRIAQRPVHPYDAAKMLVADRVSSSCFTSDFQCFSDYINEKDLVVFNDTKVFPARFLGHFLRNGQPGGVVEVLLLQALSPDFEGIDAQKWTAFGRPLKKFREGIYLDFGAGLRAQIIERLSSEVIILKFFSETNVNLKNLMCQQGTMPIPPYIRAGRGDEADRVDYQTIFAKVEGSIAAPTASLHFTPKVRTDIERKGGKISFITLHVGESSIRPLARKGQTAGPPGLEKFDYTQELVDQILKTKAYGGRVIAVGTTVVRALETIARIQSGDFQATKESTDLFITPGFEFKWVDAMVTNFHQPGTTHLLLVEAFMGRNLIEKSYNYALANDFRFLSYGDGMLIL